MPPGAAIAASHRFGGTGTALTIHLWGARGGGMQARLHPVHDSGELGNRALAAAGAPCRGDKDQGAVPEALNFEFCTLPLLRGPLGDGGPSPMGLPAVANTAGRLAPAGAARDGAAARTGPPVSVTGVPARNGTVAGSIGPTRGGGSNGAVHVPLVWHVFGGAFGTHGSVSRGASRRRRGPLGLCDRAPTPSRCALGLPMGTFGRGPTTPGATNGAAGLARRPAARVAVGGVLRNGALGVG